MQGDTGENGDSLPPFLETLWGLRAPSRRSRPALSLGRIVGAAIEIADGGGLGAVSMGRVAERLGFTTMALYRHVRGKDELLAAMLDSAIGAPPDLSGRDGWRSGLEEWARAQFAVLQRHPWIPQVPLSGPPLTPNALAWLDAGLACLAETRLHEAEKIAVMMLLDGHVRREAKTVQELQQSGWQTGAAATASYGRTLARLVTPEDFPALRAALDSGVFGADLEGYTSSDVAFGLRLLLDGVEQLVRSRDTAFPTGG
ncbi:TetR/AcrR family transcriptional regulator [Marinactinospora endophytica]